MKKKNNKKNKRTIVFRGTKRGDAIRSARFKNVEKLYLKTSITTVTLSNVSGPRGQYIAQLYSTTAPTIVTTITEAHVSRSHLDGQCIDYTSHFCSSNKLTPAHVRRIICINVCRWTYVIETFNFCVLLVDLLKFV